MHLEIGFGAGTQPVDIPDGNVLDVLMANEMAHPSVGEAEIRRALAEPIGAPVLEQVVKAGERVAIVTSDITRPCPTKLLLPPVLERLYRAGVRPEDVTVVFALGSHRRHTPEEMERLAGPEAYRTVRCVDSDPDDCVHMGTTSRGTPVDVFRAVAEADRRICLGNIEFHYFAGYSGGGKAIMPGVSTRAAIQANHSMMISEDACAGKLEGNPIREDIEEAVTICTVDYILNVVLDEHKQVVRAVAGDVVAAHRAGCRYLKEMYAKPISRLADIVLVSQGGAPKDLNLYQTQKALDNAKHAVRPGGVIILVGSCKEGLGERVFDQWIREANSARDLIDRVRSDFQLGGHKAAAIAMVTEKADVYLVSEMDEALVRKCYLHPFSTVQAALDAAFAKVGRDAGVLVMPYGGSTLPQYCPEGASGSDCCTAGS